jgi:hemolysin III
VYHGERFNSFSHLAGTVLAAAGVALLFALAAGAMDARRIVGVSIYAATLVLLFAVSTLYHTTRGRAKAVLRKLDHCAIYLLIAGTYTPFALVTLRGAWGWSLFGLA